MVIWLAVFSLVCLRIATGNELVTCTSVIKLQNVQRGVRLHSHEVKYGSGSGQQSVTGVTNSDDVNSYWVIKNASNKPECKRGAEIKCGDVIRLQHFSTGRNLHSHTFTAPITGSHQEVSAFGENGKGDEGDNWQVVCSSDLWYKSSAVRLRHVITSKYLTVPGGTYGRPIAGQYEITAHGTISDASLWRPAEAVMFMPSNEDSAGHDEL
ncbi:hypothetical protein ACHWQZ_G005575 [Mnemiopsis leidyi]